MDVVWTQIDPGWTWVDLGWTWVEAKLTWVWTLVGPGVDPNLSQMTRLYNQSVPPFHYLVSAFNQLDRWVLKEFKRF